MIRPRVGRPTIGSWPNGWRTAVATPSPSGPTRLGPTPGPTIDEVIVRFLQFAQAHYRQNGRMTSEVGNLKDALRPLHKLYGPTPAKAFGPKALKSVRERMVEDGLSRNSINARVHRIVRMFKWAASEEIILAGVYLALKTVSGLQRGRTRARETEPVKPVPDPFVDAIRPHVSPPIWAMVELLRLSGMRPGEVCLMRACDLDASGRVWTYRPETHKTAHRGRDRVIYLGPHAQEVLRPWLRPELAERLFQPPQAEANRRSGGRYDTFSLGRAIRKACERAGVPAWSPGRLRHSVATRVRKSFGLEASQIVLGHARADVTQVYAEANERLAAEVALKIG